MHMFLLCLVITLVNCSTLKVIHPNNLKNKFAGEDYNGMAEYGLIKSSVGNFGHIDYGTSIIGRLHYPLNNTDGCLPFEESNFDPEHLKESRLNNHKVIVMVDRGSCHFVLKA